jgi:hypothetical protein
MTAEYVLIVLGMASIGTLVTWVWVSHSRGNEKDIDTIHKRINGMNEEKVSVEVCQITHKDMDLRIADLKEGQVSLQGKMDRALVDLAIIKEALGKRNSRARRSIKTG